MKHSALILFLLICFTIPGRGWSQAEYLQLKAAIHCDSKISGGKYTITQLAEMMEDNHIDVGIITDHDHVEIEYSLFPLRKLLKFKITKSSISTYGVNNYLQQFDNINNRSLNLLLLPGVEAVPYYQWEGSLLPFNLTVKNWHRHLLVFGMKETADFKNLPSLASGYPKTFSHRSIILAIFYFIIFFAGFVILKHKRKPNNNSQFFIRRNKRSQLPVTFRTKKPRSTTYKVYGLLLLGIGLFGLIYNFPFKEATINAYSKNSDLSGYQYLIDYVNQRHGLIFWAHPEMHHSLTIRGINFNTVPYPELLLKTQNYTGFAIFWEGMKQIGKPGGIWDMVLNQYCQGKRNHPVWAIGELDFEDENDPKLLTETLTNLFATEKSPEAIIEALRTGRMYATRNFAHKSLKLIDFSVGENKRAISGEQVVLNHSPIINIEIRISKPANYKLQLIRNGKVIATFSEQNRGRWHIEYEDTDIQSDNNNYYRFLIYANNWSVLASNPIFVKLQKDMEQTLY